MKSLLKVTAFSLLLASINLLIAANRSEGRPNIILYVTDDQGTNDAGCYGNPVIKTPGLDYLASQGIRFTQAYAAVSSCSPSRSTILSGLYCHASGQYGLHHSFHNFNSLPHLKTLSAILAEAGYRTIIAGKYHLGPEADYPFQHFVNNYLAEGATYQLPDKAADLCRKYISSESGKPFFLYFCPKEPHSPFFRQEADTITAEQVILPSYLADQPVWRERLAKYYMSVQQADSGLVRLIEILKETNQWDNTIIVYCSDNGAPFPGAKTNLYDPGIRLPFVIRLPGTDRIGRVSDAMISWVDIAPTLLELAGIQMTNVSFQGRSFAELLSGNEAGENTWNEIYASQIFHQITFYYPMRAVRTKKYKLIWNIEPELAFPGPRVENQALIKEAGRVFSKRSLQAYINRPQFELYDMENDPDEVRNLAAKPAYRPVLDDLGKKIKKFISRTNDPWAYKWPENTSGLSAGQETNAPEAKIE